MILKNTYECVSIEFENNVHLDVLIDSMSLVMDISAHIPCLTQGLLITLFHKYVYFNYLLTIS